MKLRRFENSVLTFRVSPATIFACFGSNLVTFPRRAKATRQREQRERERIMVEETEEEEEEEVYKGPSLPPPPPPSVSVQSLVGKKNNGGQKSALPVVAAKDHTDKDAFKNAVDASHWSHSNDATLKRSGGDDPDNDNENNDDYEVNENSHWWTLEARSVALSREAKVQWNPEVDLPCEDARERQMKAQTGEFNVWYGKSATAPGALSYHERKPAPTRCVAAFDCGTTKADALADTTENTSIYWCLHFARGRCTYGNRCEYIHRLPTGLDDAKRKDLMYDLFGRSKHALEKADNSGAGSYLRDVRTLFIYYAGSIPEHWGSERMEREIRKDFGEWGPIEAVDVKHDRTFCFVRYKFRASAEFAKEAMEGQRIGNSKIHELPLSVRWANDDPNPVAIVRVKRERETLVADAIIRGIEKKQREMSAKEALEQKMIAQVKEGEEYPDTSAFYDDEEGKKAMVDAEKEKKEEEERNRKSFKSNNVEEEEEDDDDDDDGVTFDPDDYE
jgi:hypothetical protein